MLQTPHKFPSLQEHHAFNRAMSKVRVVVEWAFGRVKETMRSLKRPLQLEANEEVTRLSFLHAIILMNIRHCMRGYNTTSTFFQLRPPSLDEYLNLAPDQFLA